MSENKKEIKKLSSFKKQINLIIAFALAFVLLTVAYFVFVAPLLEDDENPGSADNELVLLDGEYSIANNIFIFESIDRQDINEVKIHNPKNSSYGEKYVDWGFKVYTENGKTVLGLTGYEYAPTDSTALSYLVNGVAYPIASSRVEEHCTDFSKYGLEYSDGNHDDLATYYTIERIDGVSHKIYIGDLIPSGSGYYVRCADKVKDKDGNEYVRDSVYIRSSSTLSSSVLSTPMKMVQPMLTYPISTQSSTGAFFSAFALSSTDGELNVAFSPNYSSADDDFSSFSGLAIYKAIVPEGYYGSTDFESLVDTFTEFNGDAVMELASLNDLTDKETGEDYKGYSFDDEVYERYGLENPKYVLYFNFAGVDNLVYFSDIRNDGYYYAYSLVFNTICKVNPETVYFLEWKNTQYIQHQVFQMMIDKCLSISVSGDLGNERVEERFDLSGTGKALVIKTSSGNVIDTENFRAFYEGLITINIVENVPDTVDVTELIKEEPYAKIEVSTRDSTAKKIYRFYRYTNGRALCTIEAVDSKGVSSGESGEFYVRMSKLEKLIDDTVKVRDGIKVEKRER